MNVLIKYSAMFLIGGVLCSTNLSAQQTDSVFADLDYIYKRNVWLHSKNAIGLKYFEVPKISRANLYFNKGNGDFKNYHESDNSISYGLNAESIYKLSSRVMVSGEINYQNFQGKNMGGSAFIDPYQNPFDIVELDNNNKGTKKQELYNLKCALAAQISSKWSLGGQIDYTAINFAKMKDLRHINKLLHLDLSAGTGYKVSPTIELGLNYNYIRRIESISFNVYGNVDKPYQSLISFGSFYGRSEVFDDNYSIYAAASARPLVQDQQQVSVQLSLALAPNTTWFNNFTYGTLNGYYGEKETASAVYTEHQATDYKYNGQVAVKQGKLAHYITLTASYRKLNNLQNIYRKETTPGGVSRNVYYGQNEVLDREQINADLGYTLFMNVKNNNPLWVLDLTGNYLRLQQTATALYPFYRDQTIESYRAYANLKRNMVKANNMYSFAVGIGYGSGSGIAKYDGLYATPSADISPVSMDLFLYQEYEYFTKPRVSADVALKYTKALKQRVAPYVGLKYSYTNAFDTQFIGSSYSFLNASIGCNF
jgi:hypothetical protein